MLKSLLYNAVRHEGALLQSNTPRQLYNDISRAVKENSISLQCVEDQLRAAAIANRECSLGAHTVLAILLYKCNFSHDYIAQYYDQTVAKLTQGLVNIYALCSKNASVESENFRKLLLSSAQDVRIIIIMIIERVQLMRQLNSCDIDTQQQTALEAKLLYAPIAHRMGLYTLKTELEDLSLKYLDNTAYKDIAHKLNETKRTRDAYIKKFIDPVRSKLEKTGLSFEIKGRTKSIFSIWNKMQKQKCAFENVYDLFAIRIIIDCPRENESAACWLVYSEITSMYTPNTNRLRDWISSPKSNGYESLHITVMGPEGKWVEVQIRTHRMDEVAEKGIAAHWKYKGGKSDSERSDLQLKNLRDMLEQNAGSDAESAMDAFKMQLYEDDVFVFTPKGDLHQLHRGATILDFAYQIHSRIGDQCMGAIVNGKHASFKQELHNGDQVQILTSASQQPAPSWLKVVQTPKAKYHIRQAIERALRIKADAGREMLTRRLKNWKLSVPDPELNRLARRLGYKHLLNFFAAIADEKISLNRELFAAEETVESVRSTNGYTSETELEKKSRQSGALIIDGNLSNIDYSLAKCCNPVFGDEIFGYVTAGKGIKIHRRNCPNAPVLFAKYSYRITNAQWAGKGDDVYATAIRVVGRDNMGILNNITSVISKENSINMQSIQISSRDGLFEGTITLMIHSLEQLEPLINKLRNIKGVKEIYRI